MEAEVTVRVEATVPASDSLLDDGIKVSEGPVSSGPSSAWGSAMGLSQRPPLLRPKYRARLTAQTASPLEVSPRVGMRPPGPRVGRALAKGR